MISRELFEKIADKQKVIQSIREGIYNEVNKQFGDIDEDQLEWAVKTIFMQEKKLVKSLKTKQELEEVIKDYGFSQAFIDKFWDEKPPHIKEFTEHGIRKTIDTQIKIFRDLDSKLNERNN